MSDTATGAPMPAPMGWKVTRQVPQQGGVQVQYTTDDGTLHYLFVPAASYTAEQVASMINDQVAEQARIAGLTSGS